MQETVKERLISYLKSIPMSQKTFCDKIGVSKGYITNMVSGFGRDVLFRIKSQFPDLSVNWLLYGEGEGEAAAWLDTLLGSLFMGDLCCRTGRVKGHHQRGAWALV